MAVALATRRLVLATARDQLRASADAHTQMARAGPAERELLREELTRRDKPTKPDRGWLAALVLEADGIVHAYPTVTAAKAAHPNAGEPSFVSEHGALRTEDMAEFALLKIAPNNQLFLPQPRKQLPDSLLRTNIQKSVRRCNPTAARNSLLQLLAQRNWGNRNNYNRKFLIRLPIIAAEDATVVPLLPMAIFHWLGATTYGPDAVDASAYHLGECAASLACAPRDPACTSKAQWTLDEDRRVAFLKSGREDGSLYKPEHVFDRGWSSQECGMYLTLWAVKRMRGQYLDEESRWLMSLEIAVMNRLANGRPACPPPRVEGEAAVMPPIQLCPQGTLLGKEHRHYFSADYHNEERWFLLRTFLYDSRGVKPGPNGKRGLPICNNKDTLKEAMREKSYLNVSV